MLFPAIKISFLIGGLVIFV